MSGWMWIALGAGAVWWLSQQTRARVSEAMEPIPTFEELQAMTPAQRTEFFKRVQRVLSADGFYEGQIDGIPGPSSRRAAAAWAMLRPSVDATNEYELLAAILRRMPEERAAP